MPRTFRRLAVAALLAIAVPCSATMVARLRLDEVSREAARVVHGTVADVRSGLDENGLAATWVTLDVVRTLKGAGAPRFTFKQYGVVDPLPGGVAARVPGLPRYAVGDEVVLFLRGESRRGFTSPVGFGQGVYRVSRRRGPPEVRGEAESAPARDLEAFLADVAQLTSP